MAFKIFKRNTGTYQFGERIVVPGKNILEYDDQSGEISILKDDYSAVVSKEQVAFFHKDDAGTPYASYEEFEEGVRGLFFPNEDYVLPENIRSILFRDPTIVDPNDQMNMNKNFTGTTKDYIIQPFAGEYWKAKRILLTLAAGTQPFNSGDFANLSALATPIELIVERGGVELTYDLKWATNRDIALTMYDFTNPFKDGAYVGRWTITKDIEFPEKLGPDDKLIVRFNNIDLSTITEFKMFFKGRKI